MSHFNYCNKCDGKLELHSQEDLRYDTEYWICSECDTEYQVDVEIERDFFDMVEVTNHTRTEG